MVGHLDRKIHLVVDRHSVHRSKTVRTWLASHQDEIELHPLPSYSPRAGIQLKHAAARTLANRITPGLCSFRGDGAG
ncbi:transposase [Streptomyces sp. XD-27]|uniref:transposase n=1 Tax=Streptomyces sp. XD-27 TaxID=3062779 RepID=UPI00350E51CE